MASREQFRKIAMYCDEYSSQGKNQMELKSGDVETRESCLNCRHFENHRCELDLIDKVLSSLSMDTELKS